MEQANQEKAAAKCFGRLGWALCAAASVLLLTSLFSAVLMVADELLAAAGRESYLYIFEPPGMIYWLFFRLPVYAAGIPAALLILKKLPRKPVPKHRLSAKQIVGFGLAAIAIEVPVNLLLVLLTSLGSRNVQLPILAAAPGVSFWSILDLLVLAPLFEELLFRKVLLDRFRRYGEGLAMLVSAAVFGLMHMNFQQTAVTFVLGALLAFVYLRSGSLWYCVLLHGASNLLGSGMVTLLLSRLSPKAWMLVQTQNEDLLTADVLTELYPLAAYMALICCLIAAGWAVLIRSCKKIVLAPAEEQLAPKSAAKAVLGSVGMLLYLAVTLFFIVTNMALPFYQI